MATRLYLPSTGAAPISPAPSATWSISSSMDRRAGVTAKISSAMASATVAYGAQSAGGGAVRQYIFPPMAAQTISGTVKVQVRCSETDAANSVFCRMGLRVVSNDGTTVRGTLLDVANYGGTIEFATALTNRIFANGDTLTNVGALAGDRIVLELGIGSASGWTGNASLSFGDDSGTDLPEDITTTAANNPWIEFSMNIAWQAASVSLTPGAGGLVASGGTPSRVVGTLLTPSMGTLAALANTPVLVIGTVLRPAVAALLLDGQAPTLLNPITVTPGAGSLTVSGYSPVAVRAIFLTPASGVLSIAGIASSLALGTVLMPSGAVIVITGIAPALRFSTLLTPLAGTLTITGHTPTLVTGQLRIPGTGTFTITGLVPTLTSSQLPVVANAIQARYKPRPLFTITIGAETKRYSSEDIETP